MAHPQHHVDPATRPGQYWYVHPLSNVRILGKRPSIRVGKALFVTRRALARRVSTSAPWQTICSTWREPFLSGNAFALLPINGSPATFMAYATTYCREALWILAATRLVFGHRSHLGAFGLQGDVGATVRHRLAIGRSHRGAYGSSQSLGSLMPFDIDDNWHALRRRWRVNRLIASFDTTRVSEKWRATIWRAAALAGRSVLCDSASDALLYNVTALEVLLVAAHEHKEASLQKRLRGMLGWPNSGERRSDIDANITFVYETRSAVVHAGQHAKKMAEALYLSDHYLANALYNVAVVRPWKNKGDCLQHLNALDRTERYPKRLRLTAFQLPFRVSDYSLPLN